MSTLKLKTFDYDTDIYTVWIDSPTIILESVYDERDDRIFNCGTQHEVIDFSFEVLEVDSTVLDDEENKVVIYKNKKYLPEWLSEEIAIQLQDYVTSGINPNNVVEDN